MKKTLVFIDQIIRDYYKKNMKRTGSENKTSSCMDLKIKSWLFYEFVLIFRSFNLRDNIRFKTSVYLRF